MTKKHDIIWLAKVDSTNEEARRHISELDNLSVVSAFSQTAGRGQRGNTWSSAEGCNLTFSIILKNLEIRAIDQFVISEITALSVIDLLGSHDIDARIKWPNDIYVGNNKICGILIENSLRDRFLSYSIVGVGLNVNQREFDPSLPNPTSMALCKKEKGFMVMELEPLLEEFVSIFKGYLSRYLNITGGYTRLRKLYLAQLWRLNEAAIYIDINTGNKFEGIIRGLSDIGNLIVEDKEKGELKEFAFKEIGFSLS